VLEKISNHLLIKYFAAPVNKKILSSPF
jgi:hypothetical protein